MNDADAKAEYLAKLKEHLNCSARNDDWIPPILVPLVLAAADKAWEASAKVNYAQGVVDGQLNLATAIQMMGGRLEQ